ncbi:hypothetical protein [Pontibacter sp. G13]|uniref:hypothetical protein n=1 Tax=Pontibacter sp. G13 TaxID=3074898 RepID=UPI00288B442A|nr:hypothetical protein [Pontibacter sp. G13]WNJ19866.1 hypothetical protein RJD25_05230 [Pontibacter sp. G13]
MAHELHLHRTTPNFSHQFPVSPEEWEEWVSKHERFKFQGDRLLMVYSTQLSDWVGVISVQPNGTASARAAAVLQSEDALKAWIELAEHFGAMISGDEGEVLYLPVYGAIYEEGKIGERGVVTVQNLVDAEVTLDLIQDEDIEQILVRSREQGASSSEAASSQSDDADDLKKWWEFWK